MSSEAKVPLAPHPNSAADDIAGVIGFTATLRLCAWYGADKHNLYVPGTATEDHPIARIIGMPAFRRLVQEWGNQHLNIPMLAAYEEDCRYRLMRDLLAKGVGYPQVARIAGLSERRVQQVRVQLEEAGLLPMVMGR